MPYLIHSNSSDSGSINREFDPEIDGRLDARLSVGTSITEEQRAAIPRILRIEERRRGGVPAIIGWSIGPFIICERLRDILEELEPGRHDFVPIEVRSLEPGPDEKVFGTYYLIVCPVRLDAVIIEETTFTKGFGREGYERSARIDTDDDGQCVLDQDVIEGHHFWQLPEGFGSTPDHPTYSVAGYFCSDELWRRIRAEKMDGWAAEKKCIAKRR